MKKFLLSLPLALCITLLVSCDFIGKITSKDGADSLASADSLSVDAQPAETATPADLVFFDAKGPVKSIMEDNHLYEFDENGRFVACDGKDPFAEWDEDYSDDFDPMDLQRWERNDEGLITQHYGWEWSTTYIWKDGIIVKQENYDEAYSSKFTYHYDSDGRIESLEGTEYEELFDEDSDGTSVQEIGKETITYTYEAVDDHGNWTTCTTHFKSVGDTDVHERKIIYY